ncbi:MAG: PAS domain S-box protein [Rhodospirillales bacterium]|nr:PAS domain S-box protein [Rhodospirillales bacterium]
MTSFRSFPTLAGLIIVASVAAMASWRTWNDYVATIEAAETMLAGLVRSGDEQLTGTLRAIDVFLQEADQRLSETPTDDRPKLVEFLKKRMKAIDNLRVVFVTDQNDIVTFATLPSLVGFDGSERQYFHTARGPPEQDRLHLLGPRVAATGAQVVFAFRARRDQNGVLQGVIAATMAPAFFEDMLQSIAPQTPPGYATLLSPSLDIIFRSPDGAGMIGRSLKEAEGIRQHLASGRQDSVQHFHSMLDGVDRLGAFRTDTHSGAYVLVTIDRSKVLAPFKARTTLHGSIFVLIAALVVFLVRRLQARETALVASQRKLVDTNVGLATEVKARTAEIRDREARTRAILDTVVDGIIVIDEAGIVEVFNPAAARIFGHDADAVMGRNVSMLMPEPDRSRHDGYLANFRQTGKATVIGIGREVRGLRKDGTIFPMHLAVSEMQANGARKFTGVVRDITTRKRAEAELGALAKEKSLLLESTEEGIYGIDVDGLCTFVNGAAARLLGYAASDMIGRNMHDLIHHRHADGSPYPVASCPINHAFRSGRSCAVEDEVFWRKDGRPLPVAYAASPIRDDDRIAGAVVTFSDITERKRFLKELQDSQTLLSAAIENIPGGFILVDAEDRVELFNEKFKQLYPPLAGSLRRGARFEDLIRLGAKRGVYPDARDRIEDWVAARMTRHREPEISFEERLANDQWVRVAIRRLPSGQRAGIHLDITELVRARQEADRANRAKSDFLSSMSHELRTPLNAILGFGQLLETGYEKPLSEKQKEYVGYILKSGNHLLELITEVLDLARIEAGKLSLSPEAVELGGVIDECLTVIEGQAERRGIVLIAPTFTDRRPAVRADRLRLRQILLNLLSNAVKYNRPNGTVTLSVDDRLAETVRITVADTGIGIPPHKQHELFTPFSRLGAETTEIEGTGIGLTITRRLTEAMGGRVGFVSTQGEGSSFWIEVPRAAAMPGGVPEPGREAGTVAPTTAEPELRMTVLYVEDNPSNIHLVERIAETIPGLALATLPNAELALDMAARTRPDLILIDINLPGMNGLEAVRHLKSDPATRAIPVIVLSADATPRTIREALAVGCQDYLTKPVDVARLRAAIRAVAEGRHAQA